MDFIKETYDVLNSHLGADHRGGKKLGPEYDELKKDVQALVLHALKVGKVFGADTVCKEHREFSNTLSQYHIGLHQDLRDSRYESKANVSK